MTETRINYNGANYGSLSRDCNQAGGVRPKYCIRSTGIMIRDSLVTELGKNTLTLTGVWLLVLVGDTIIDYGFY